ncbi:hypothetical protein [Caballeronia sordidicola]|jgi:hypothetical protein|uniref:hypothetical protein n=1 Tax=Caballeronia sordidicola TaxID=196367 RepID=UPI0004CFF3A5|nr:hypothetical protein [Caballeronia sordidicola]
MLRWLLAVLFLANLLMFVVVQGVFGPLPAAGGREPQHLDRQVHPELVRVRPIGPEEAADQPMVGGPAPAAAVQAAPLAQ